MIKYLFKVSIFLFKQHSVLCCFDVLLFTLNMYLSKYDSLSFWYFFFIYVLTVNNFYSYWWWICNKFENFTQNTFLFVYLSIRLKIRWNSSDHCFCYLSCLFTTSIWQVIERVHVVYDSWFSWRHEPLLHFGIGGPTFSQGSQPPWSQSIL